MEASSQKDNDTTESRRCENSLAFSEDIQYKFTNTKSAVKGDPEKSENKVEVQRGVKQVETGMKINMVVPIKEVSY